MCRLSIVIFLVYITVICGKVFVDVLQEGPNNSLESGSCYTQLMKCTETVNECKSSLEHLNEEWNDKQSIQQRALQDITDTILNRQRVSELKTVSSCEEALAGSNDKGGVFVMNMSDKGLLPFQVYCLKDRNDDSPWMLIQRRLDGSIDFYRGWFDYKHGFGNIDGEFWLGLAKLHVITTSLRYELWIHMEDFEGQLRYAKYSSFAIGDEQSNYMLKILGKFSGDGGDGMTSHQGQGFSTKDSDNDKLEDDNCALVYGGAWWYRNCYDCNLNGIYSNGTQGPAAEGKGVEWFPWHSDYSLKVVHMAIRPILN